MNAIQVAPNAMLQGTDPQRIRAVRLLRGSLLHFRPRGSQHLAVFHDLQAAHHA